MLCGVGVGLGRGASAREKNISDIRVIDVLVRTLLNRVYSVRSGDGESVFPQTSAQVIRAGHRLQYLVVNEARHLYTW